MNKYTEQLEEMAQSTEDRARDLYQCHDRQGVAMLAARTENKLKALEKWISRPVKEILDTEKELRAKIKELLEENNKLRVQIEGAPVTELRERLKRAQAARDAALTENTALRSKLGLRDKIIREMEHAQVQYAEELEKRIEDLERARNYSRRCAAAWEAEYEQVRWELDAQRNAHDRVSESKRELEERLEKAEVALDTEKELRARITELEAMNHDEKAEAAIWQGHFSAASEQNDRLKAELNATKEELARAQETAQQNEHMVSMCHMTLEAAVGSIAHCEDGIFPDTIHVEDEGLVYVVAAGSREQNIALLDEARDRVMRYVTPLGDEEPNEEDRAQDRAEAMKVPEGEYVISTIDTGMPYEAGEITLRASGGTRPIYQLTASCKKEGWKHFKTIEDPRLAQLLYRMAKDQT